MKRWSCTIILLSAVMWLLFCTDDYNPFGVLENADLHIIKKTFENGDTIPIFSSETLQVVITVRENIDSFTIEALNNRFWNDTTVSDLQKPKTFPFIFSFSDTGKQTIEILTYRKNQDVLSQSLNLYTYSPLHQKDLGKVYLGQSLSLSTPAVNDPDVIYTWKLGDNEIISSDEDTTVVFHQNNLTLDYGKLWVLDYTRNIVSPAHKFFYSYEDTIKPTIELAMNRPLDSDTLRVSENICAVVFRIYDQNQSPVWQARINGEKFDRENRETQTYTKVMHDLIDQQIVSLEVHAIDNRMSGNSSTKKIYLTYDPQADPLEVTRIRYGNDGADNQMVVQQNKNIMGYVEDPLRSTIIVHAIINENTYYDTITIDSTTGDGLWSWDDVELSQNQETDTLIVRALDLNGDTLSTREFYLLYDPNIEDTIPPDIFRIIYNGESENSVAYQNKTNYIRQDSLRLSVTVFDIGSGIETFLVDGLPIQASSLNKYIREVTLPLYNKHDDFLFGNESEFKISLLAIDKRGNENAQTLTFFHNDPPRLQKNLNLPRIVYTDMVYRDTIRCMSNDPDSVYLYVIHKPHTMKTARLNSKQFTLQWIPSINDTGIIDSLAFLLDDKKEQSETYVNSFYILDSTKKDYQLEMRVDDNSMPDFLEAVYDTLSLPITISEGAPPYTIKMTITNNQTVILDTVIRSDTVTWVAEEADTGNINVEIIATDQLLQSDTILHPAVVVTPNKPCSVFVDSIFRDSIDMSEKAEPEILTIYVSDPDSMYLGFAEWISLRIIHRGNEITLPVNRDLQAQYTLSPVDITYFVDTLTILAKDRRSHTDTLKIPVHYGTRSPRPQAVYPTDNTIIEDTAVTFIWECDSSDLYTYTLFWIANETIDTLAQGFTDTTFTLENVTTSGVYSWYVTMSDSEQTFVSDTSDIYLRNPGHVSFKTTEDQFPVAMYAGRDSFAIKLEVTDKSAHPPFRFTAEFEDTTQVFFDSIEKSIIKIKPDNQFTGFLSGLVIVSDTNDNSDTLYPVVEIKPNNSHPFSFDLFVDGVKYHEDSVIDMTADSKSHDLVYKVNDTTGQSSTLYDIWIEQNGLTIKQELNLESSDSLHFSLSPQPEISGYEIMRAITCNSSGEMCDTIVTRLFYGDHSHKGPADIYDSIKVWLRADTGVVFDENNSVSYWNDISGNYHHGKAKTDGTALPHYISSLADINAMPAVEFTGTDSAWMQLRDFGLNTSTDDFSIFLITVSDSTTGTIFANGTNLVCTQDAYRYSNNDPISTSFTGKSLISIIQAAEDVTIYNNSTLETQSLTLDRSGGIDSSFVFCKDNSEQPQQYFDGCIAEIIIYNRALTSDEIAAIDNYFIQRYSFSDEEDD